MVDKNWIAENFLFPVIGITPKEQEVIKLMLEKVVADSTMHSNKYEESTNLSACPVPPKYYSNTT